MSHGKNMSHEKHEHRHEPREHASRTPPERTPHEHKPPEHKPHGHAETAAEEVIDEVEDAEARGPLAEEEREAEKGGEAADTLTPSPKAQEDVQNT
ncbi:hypothetical protein [Streptomyces varsoviensis]|uniref:Uncharacterized protein n=1 Tax=Streptomyces varsoviensis TaxID=67373 RepID=A0ABR5J2M2_9ACTN|nr:hypothetical protein [Streptomyces varsoviensis]KOG87614.1 hypothetical protein ADK38_24455 [Streptomyces varsoviensis]